jgi:hypothetical protein
MVFDQPFFRQLVLIDNLHTPIGCIYSTAALTKKMSQRANIGYFTGLYFKGGYEPAITAVIHWQCVACHRLALHFLRQIFLVCVAAKNIYQARAIWRNSRLYGF